jgi:hypothetical protein
LYILLIRDNTDINDAGRRKFEIGRERVVTHRLKREIGRWDLDTENKLREGIPASAHLYWRIHRLDVTRGSAWVGR